MVSLKGARQARGRSGEDLAALFLYERGFHLVSRNWSCRVGEIDLIVERARTIHFVEVKTRRSRSYGIPEEAVTSAKLRHLSRAIHVWLQQQRVPPEQYQMDVIAIEALPGFEPVIRWIQHVASE